MKHRIARAELPPNRRILVTSDIHGQLGCLKGVLEKAQLSQEDILIIVGDMIEKGPDSLGTLRYVMRLCETHTVYPLMGNVDAYQVELLSRWNAVEVYGYLRHRKSRWGSCLIAQMCSELGICVRSPLDLLRSRAKIREAFQKELAFLQGLPTILETQHMIFVHGGLPGEPVAALEGKDAHPCLKNDAFLEKGLAFSKYVVVGHWPVTLYHERLDCSNPIVNRERKIISIDGGCSLKRTGQLNLFVIPSEGSEDFSFFSYDGLPLRTALDAQEESKTSSRILFTDNEIRILERGEEFSLVEHVRGGQRLWVFNEDIWKSGGKTHCDDCNDYRLPVHPGDRLAIVRETSRGYLVKKGGVAGWYTGRLGE